MKLSSFSIWTCENFPCAKIVNKNKHESGEVRAYPACLQQQASVCLIPPGVLDVCGDIISRDINKDPTHTHYVLSRVHDHVK